MKTKDIVSINKTGTTCIIALITSFLTAVFLMTTKNPFHFTNTQVATAFAFCSLFSWTYFFRLLAENRRIKQGEDTINFLFKEILQPLNESIAAFRGFKMRREEIQKLTEEHSEKLNMMPAGTSFQASIAKVGGLEIEGEFERKIAEITRNATLDMNSAKAIADSLKEEMETHFEHAKATHNTLKETLLTEKESPSAIVE